MKLLGFNFTKINAYKGTEFKSCPASITIEFEEIIKDKIDMIKDSEVLNATFTFSVKYSPDEKKAEKNEAEIAFQGNILFAADKDESKEILKEWKKKELSASFKIPLFNLILKRCSTKALNLEEELSLPYHMPLPKISMKK